MHKHSNRKDIETAANIAQIVSTSLQILGIIIPLITVGFLTTQKEIISIDKFNFQLGAWYQILLLLCALVTYFQFLRNHWERKREVNNYRPNFLDFLKRELVIKKPILLTGLILIIGSLIYVLGVGFLVLVVVIPFLVLIILSDISMNRSVELEQISTKWEKNEDYKLKWTKRIDDVLDIKGSVETSDFNQIGLGSKYYREVNFMLDKYFEIHEFDKKLAVTPKKNIVDNFGQYITSQKVTIK